MQKKVLTEIGGVVSSVAHVKRWRWFETANENARRDDCLNDPHSAMLRLAGFFNAYFFFLTEFFGNQKIIRDLDEI